MPKLPHLQMVDRTHVRHQGRKLVYFAGCDYFRLSFHPVILKAIREGLVKYGLSVAASRVTTGNHALYELLESKLAAFFGMESATLAPNGYAPNLMVAQALAGQFSHALLDERAHGSLRDAAQLLDCRVLTFKHRDTDDLKRALQRLKNARPIVLTDGMFSQDGSVAPLKDYLRVLPSRGMLLVDDAHGAGLLGANGRGTLEHTGARGKNIILTVTLSKAFGVYGGAVLGSRRLREEIIARSRLFIGSTPLPLPLAHAAIASLALLRRDRKLWHRLTDNLERLKAGLRASGFEVPNHPGPIVVVVPKNKQATAWLSRKLLAAQIYPSFIHYPGGPENGCFRFVISSEHTPEQLERLRRALTA